MTSLEKDLLEQLIRQNQLLTEIISLGKAQAEVNNVALWHIRNSTKNENAIRVNSLRPLLNEVRDFTDTYQLGLVETVRTISEKKLSFARFGDGEIKLMLRDTYSLEFQANSPELAESLQKVYTSEDDNLLLGFPNPNRDIHWSEVWADIWDDLMSITKMRKYGNTQVTRPSYFQYTRMKGIQAWRDVWEGRNAVIITGEGSRFDLVPELFDNLASHEYLYSLPTNAYADLERVLDAVGAAPKADIALISLGPTGTLLAAELETRGMQAIDIGHISASYLHAFRGGPWPEAKPASVAVKRK